VAALSRGRDALWLFGGWLVAAVAVRLLRGYPWTLSAIVGAACATLLLATLRTGRALRATTRRPGGR